MLNHVNIVKLHAIVFEPDHYGVVLEYIPHGDLDNYTYKHKVRYDAVETYTDMKISGIICQILEYVFLRDTILTHNRLCRRSLSDGLSLCMTQVGLHQKHLCAGSCREHRTIARVGLFFC